MLRLIQLPFAALIKLQSDDFRNNQFFTKLDCDLASRRAFRNIDKEVLRLFFFIFNWLLVLNDCVKFEFKVICFILIKRGLFNLFLLFCFHNLFNYKYEQDVVSLRAAFKVLQGNLNRLISGFFQVKKFQLFSLFIKLSVGIVNTLNDDRNVLWSIFIKNLTELIHHTFIFRVHAFIYNLLRNLFYEDWREINGRNNCYHNGV